MNELKLDAYENQDREAQRDRGGLAAGCALARVCGELSEPLLGRDGADARGDGVGGVGLMSALGSLRREVGRPPRQRRVRRSDRGERERIVAAWRA